MKYGSLSIDKLKDLSNSKGIRLGGLKLKGSRQQKAKARAVILDKIANHISHQEVDNCEVDTTELQVEILLAMDLRETIKGILPRSKFLDKGLSYLSKQSDYNAYYEKLKTVKSEKFLEFSRSRFSYVYNPLNRVHGFLISQDNGCAIYDLEVPPSINQLVAVCSSPFTDRVPPSKPFTVGSFLIGFYLILAKHLGYNWSILEVANDCVGGEEEEVDFYGGNEYLRGKESQHSLYCFYERFGFREDPQLFKDFKCFGIYPYPSMKLVLSDYSIDCIRDVAFARDWSKIPSNFCKKRISEDVSYSSKCSIKKQ
jgi:hypothetical protein